MLAYVATLAMMANPFAGVLADVVDPGAIRALALAERDFDERREELGLVGTAPLVGLEPQEQAGDSAALADLDSRHAELGTLGAAPLYGVGPTDVTDGQSGEGASFAEAVR